MLASEGREVTFQTDITYSMRALVLLNMSFSTPALCLCRLFYGCKESLREQIKNRPRCLTLLINLCF